MIILTSREMYNIINTIHPENPHSSAKTQKIKSVFCSGTCLNLSLLKVPFKNPFPKISPEPTADND